MLIFLELVFTSHFYLKIGLNFLQKITYKRHRLFQFKKKIKRRKKKTQENSSSEIFVTAILWRENNFGYPLALIFTVSMY